MRSGFKIVPKLRRVGIGVVGSLLVALSAPAQVVLQNPVTPGHIPTIVTNGILKDGGSAFPPLTTARPGVVSNNQNTDCIYNAAVSGPYSSLCWGVTSSAAYITLQNQNGGAALPLNFIINGVVLPYPGPQGPYLPIAGGTLTGDLVLDAKLQSIQTVDYSTLSDLYRGNLFSTTLTAATTTTKAWENFFSGVTTAGPGNSTGEVNVIHAYYQNNVGITANQVETFESSALNSGVLGEFDNYLTIFNNTATGTVTTGLNMVKAQLTNANTDAGAIGVFSAFDLEPMLGGGSRPSFYFLMSGRDQHATLAQVGSLVIGQLTPPTVPGTVLFVGPDTSNGTFPLAIQDSGHGNLFYISDAGNATFTGTVAVGSETLIEGGLIRSLVIALPGATSGVIQFKATDIAGSNIVTLPAKTGTVALNLSGTTSAIGGGSLAAGACASGTATVVGVSSSMAITVTPAAAPQPDTTHGLSIYGYVSGTNQVTVEVCAIVAATTPNAVAYNVTAIQ